MEKENIIEFKVYGRRALFSEPITRSGGEKTTYWVPTYQSLKGITESIFWKPVFIWEILKVRVMNPIQTESVGVRPLQYYGGNTLANYTYLKNVEYHVRAKFVWNENRPELEEDRNENKYYYMAKRMVEKGGRRDVFLGTRECPAYVEPCKFMEGKGAYDEIEELALGMMVHGFTYPDEATRENEKGKLTCRFWEPVMRYGIIDFIPPEKCKITREVRTMKMKPFGKGNFSILDEMR